jgi:hypothetical protein
MMVRAPSPSLGNWAGAERRKEACKHNNTESIPESQYPNTPNGTANGRNLYACALSRPHVNSHGRVRPKGAGGCGCGK